MVSGPITSLQIGGETMEKMTYFILGASKITADGDFSHEIKRHLTPWKESYDHLDSIYYKKALDFPKHWKNKDVFIVSVSSVQSLIRVWLFATP